MGTHRSEKLIAEVLGEEIAITPSELVNRVIKKQAVGGYDTDEVDDLLEQTAEVLEKLMARLRELKAVNDEQRTCLAEYREIEASLRNALVSSQKFGDDVVANAKREAELILAEAKLHRDEAQAEAARLPETITREIRLLMEERDRIREDILAVLDAHRHWVVERVPERDSALSERLLAFVNSRQGVPLQDAQTAAQETAGGANGEHAGPGESAEGHALEEDEEALPDVVLGIEPELAPEAPAEPAAAPQAESEPELEPDPETEAASEAEPEHDAAFDFDHEVLEAVTEEDDEDTVKETTA